MASKLMNIANAFQPFRVLLYITYIALKNSNLDSLDHETSERFFEFIKAKDEITRILFVYNFSNRVANFVGLVLFGLVLVFSSLSLWSFFQL